MLNLIHFLSISWDLLTDSVSPALSMSGSILSFPKCAMTLKKLFFFTRRWTECQGVSMAGVAGLVAHV